MFELEAPTLQSMVQGLQATSVDASVRLEDVSGLAKVMVRAAAGTNANVQLSGAPMGRVTERDGTLICGLGPQQWLMIGTHKDVIGAVDDLDNSGHMSVTDVTHGRSMIRVSGTEASALLSKLCDLDWREDMFPNHAISTGTLAKVRCEFVRADSETGDRSYLLGVDSSYAEYVAEVLTDAIQDFL